MGAFWNPNGGIMVSDRRLSKKEVSALKHRWAENVQRPFKAFEGWWKKIQIAVLDLFS